MPQVNGNSGNPSGAPLRPCGVWGDSRDDPGVIGTSLRRVGVRGETRDRTGVYGSSERASGVLGFGHRFGVEGISSGQGSDTDPTVYAGVYGQGHDIGVYSEGLFGIISRSTAGAGGSAGIFDGNVQITGSLLVDGDFSVLPGRIKSAVVRHPDGTLRRLHTLESPDSWFEDFGRAEVVQGHARVELDGDFAALIDADDYHVYLTAEGDSNGLYVSSRTPREFEVREQGNGASKLPFSYRVVARRKDVQSERLAIVELPPSPFATEVVPSDLEDKVAWQQEGKQ
jgi:hypothetical protein